MKQDLNLLAVFAAVARFGSVTRAADHLGLSQPAVSHALNRLRAVAGDVLFTRAGRRLVLTPRAQAMVGPVGDVLAQARALLARAQFDGATDRSVFRIGASDYSAMTVVPKLVGLVAAAAPGVTLVLAGVGDETPGMLESGKLDLTFWGMPAEEAPFHYKRLFAEHYVGVARAGHAIFAGEVTLAAYVASGHVVVSLGGPGARAVDTALAALGVVRHVRMVSPSFAGNLAAVRATDLIATMPTRILPQESLAGLRVFDLPLAVPGYDYGMVWHARTDASAAHAWLRDMVVLASA